MKLVPYDLKDIKKGYYRKTRNQKILEEFAESELDCVKVEDFPHKNAWICAAGLKRSIARFKISNVDAFSREGEVFLVKLNKVK